MMDYLLRHLAWHSRSGGFAFREFYDGSRLSPLARQHGGYAGKRFCCSAGLRKFNPRGSRRSHVRDARITRRPSSRSPRRIILRAATNAVVADLSRLNPPIVANHPDGNHLSPDVLFLQLEQTPGFVGRAVERSPVHAARSSPSCPRAPEPLAHGGGARVHLRVPADPAGRDDAFDPSNTIIYRFDNDGNPLRAPDE